MTKAEILTGNLQKHRFVHLGGVESGKCRFTTLRKFQPKKS